ncbi:glycoside hydrolase superfamily [Epithele typhae]|uniref:glycoside hydrolase superfamily n=1 Tax=Epithele typhae TaxID=378194 RepID=UPI002007F0C2|nr:glycoside hydrolase superfamily [Epithele typhae]KAH9936808.1 glycoside hydrolase superfamily [Epithele typhae]
MKSLASIVALATLLAVPAQGVAVWGQCGGIGYGGSTSCDSGTSCVYVNDYYSQCQPGTATTTKTTTSGGSTTTSASSPAATGLDKHFKAHGKVFFGTCSDSGTFSNSQDSTVTIREFGGLTPENSMKWDATEPSRNSFTFSGADALVNYATTHGMAIRAHTLVWHNQLPTWVSSITDKTTLTSVIQNHIANVAGRYKGKVRSWDVVNEMFSEDGSVDTSQVFAKVLGSSFVNIAFAAARSADPNAVLYINDYNLDSVNAKSQGLVKLVNSMNANTQLIDGIGTQMHLSAGGSSGAAAVVKYLATATKIKEVAITELDIASAPSTDYVNVVKACLAEPKCVSITVWGVRDSDSWRTGQNPLLFDDNFQPKAAYNAIISTLG